MSRSVIKKCMSHLNGGIGREGGLMRNVQCKATVSSSSLVMQFSKNGNNHLMSSSMMKKNGGFSGGGMNATQHRNYSTLLNWFKGLKGGSTSSVESTTTNSTNILPSMVVDPSLTTPAGSTAIDNNTGAPVMETDDDLFRGLQLIHETPQHEYHPPLTFGEEHELFVGGHLPHTMPHINAIQDLLQYLHDMIGKQFI